MCRDGETAGFLRNAGSTRANRILLSSLTLILFDHEDPVKILAQSWGKHAFTALRLD